MNAPAARLVIQHVANSDPAAFQVVRLDDAKTAGPICLPAPFGFPVEGRPGSHLMRELRWYLEDFLDYPFPPETDRAERVQRALQQWGEQAFLALFGSRAAGRMFDAATSADYAQLHLQISSDEPGVLAWPWEALYDPEAGFLAQTCQIERRLNKVRDPEPLPSSLSTNCVNILLVVARPYPQDVRYRSISRSLVELIEAEKVPARVDLLRPPTFDQLRRHLRERPGYYHILHFDGHGSYGDGLQGQDHTHRLRASEGVLVFEDEKGEPDPITAEQLSSLLREHAVPAMVLNACRSAMLDEAAADPFASVATALLRAGMRSVVAMAYSLYVSGAQQFLPAFYGRLFDEGSMAEAARAGRQQMLACRDRVCARGRFPLDDWLLPVLYQQAPLDFSFAVEAGKGFQPAPSKLPEELKRERDPYGFVGRDGPLLELERALRRPPAGILIQGLGGVGKTALARGFLQWLDATGGLGEGCRWLSFQEVRSAEYVLNRMGEALFGPRFGAGAIEEKIEALALELRERRFLTVWDNFESAAGIAGTAVTANLPEGDRLCLAAFLDKLRGGASKVIITSRSPEDWLGTQRRYLLPLGGLDGEERWEFCEVILRDLGRRIDRSDPGLVELMALLGGHPLAMRAILPQLEKQAPGEVAGALRSNLAELGLGEAEDQAKLFATLRFVEQGLSEELRPLLVLVGLHEGFLDADHLEGMAKQVDSRWTRTQVDNLVEALVVAGLLRGVGQAIYQTHPVLTGYLRSTCLKAADGEVVKSWERGFVDVMATLANELAPLELHEQRFNFLIHGANFHHALEKAEELQMPRHFAAVTQSLAAHAQNTRKYAEAARLFGRLAEHYRVAGVPEGEAAAYHQLGNIAYLQRDFAAAEQWYRKSLAISEKPGDEHGAAITYHQLGMLAEAQRDFSAAEQWYRKSLAISEKLGDEPSAAITYHQLGMIAGEQRDLAAAEQWYRKALAIKEKLGDEPGAATTYHELGNIAHLQRDFAAAEQRYRKSLAISEKLGIEHGTASTYHQLGMIAEEQPDFAAAEQWYRKSLAISEKLGIEHGAARTYHQLGMIAEEQRDFAAAEQWCRKALLIFEKLSDEHGATITYWQLGLSAAEQGNFVESGRWLIKALVSFQRTADPALAAQAVRDFLRSYKRASATDRAKLEALWSEAGLGPFPHGFRFRLKTLARLLWMK
jgi:tetratricopeptide (TPR) repeat protein